MHFCGVGIFKKIANSSGTALHIIHRDKSYYDKNVFKTELGSLCVTCRKSMITYIFCTVFRMGSISPTQVTNTSRMR